MYYLCIYVSSSPRACERSLVLNTKVDTAVHLLVVSLVSFYYILGRKRTVYSYSGQIIINRTSLDKPRHLRHHSTMVFMYLDILWAYLIILLCGFIARNYAINQSKIDLAFIYLFFCKLSITLDVGRSVVKR